MFDQPNISDEPSRKQHRRNSYLCSPDNGSFRMPEIRLRETDRMSAGSAAHIQDRQHRNIPETTRDMRFLEENERIAVLLVNLGPTIVAILRRNNRHVWLVMLPIHE